MEASYFTSVDYAIITLIALSTLVGLIRGFIKEVFSLAVWILAFWLAFHFSETVAILFSNHIPDPAISMVVAFALLFVATLIIGGMVNYIIGRLVVKTGLTGTDRLLGVLFGFIRGIFIITLLILLAGLTPFADSGWWQESLLLGQFQGVADWVKSLLPGYIEHYFNQQNLIQE